MFEMLVCSKIRKSVLGYGTLVRNRIGVWNNSPGLPYYVIKTDCIIVRRVAH
jgi:hypothetical protein